MQNHCVDIDQAVAHFKEGESRIRRLIELGADLPPGIIGCCAAIAHTRQILAEFSRRQKDLMAGSVPAQQKKGFGPHGEVSVENAG
jgi:hypothetical protein